MASIVRSGAWDLIGAARPSIADPFLPRKIEEGRTDDIRECTGANVCIMKVDGYGHLGCIQNATAGEEHRLASRAVRGRDERRPRRADRRGGPGRAGVRGDARAAPWLRRRPPRGGRARGRRPDALGPRLPTLGDWGRIVDHRQVMLSKLRNVEVIADRRMSVEDVLDYGAQLVIVATGSRWSGDGVQSSTHEPIGGVSDELPHVLTPEQMDGKRPGRCG